MQFLLAATEESSGGLIDVVPGLMIWTLICFAITFFALKKLAFSRIQQGIDSRRDRIRAAIDEADKAREEARELLEQHRQLIADAKGDAADILADARKVADLTLEATARVTGKVLDAEDQRRLIDEAISELDFSALEKERA